MTHLQDQTDELELLESMFSSPGEFEIEDRSSHEQAAAYLQHLTPDPPKTLSCVLHIPVNAHQDSDDEDIDDDDESVSRSVLPAAHTINISLRLLARLVRKFYNEVGFTLDHLYQLPRLPA